MYFRQELSGVCHTKAQHMISLTTRPLAWGGKVWAHAYNDVLSLQTLPPRPDTERDWCCRMGMAALGDIYSALVAG